MRSTFSWHTSSRRHWLQQLSVACVSATPLAWAQAKEKHLPTTASLPQSLQQALQTKQPLVVMVSLEGCPFCKVVRENYLLPLQREGLPVVQINLPDFYNAYLEEQLAIARRAVVR